MNDAHQIAGGDLVGQVFAEKYLIEAKLGEGGMGAVYRARHQYLQTIVAVKLVHGSLLEGDQGYQRFLREARVLNSLDHPNAIGLKDFGIEGDTPYLIMEFVEGVTLKKLIARERYFPVERVIEFLVPICGALADAHDKGIIHRDIKPDNIIIADGADPDSPKVVKVLDFGISKVVSNEAGQLAQTELTGTEMMLGTPRYIAPEQALGKKIDPRTDLYALAVMTYEMLNGSPPFSGKSSTQLIAQHLQEKPQAFDKTRKIKPALRRVILKALEKEPSRRQQSVSHFLEEFIAASGPSGVPDEILDTAPKPRLETSKGGDEKKVLGMAGVAAVLIFSGWMVVKSGVLDRFDQPDPTPAPSPTDSVTNQQSTDPEPEVANTDRPTPPPEERPSEQNTQQTDENPDSVQIAEQTSDSTEPVGQNQQATNQQDANPDPASNSLPESPSGTTENVTQNPLPGTEVSPPPLPKPEPGLYIEFKRLSDYAEALDLQQQLESRGFAVSLLPVTLGGTQYHEVLLGPFSSIPEAMSVGDRIQQQSDLEGSVGKMRTIF